MKKRDPLLASIGLGTMAGMRALSAPSRVFENQSLGWLAELELLVDKLPFTPARTSAPQLAARAASGTLSAYYFARSNWSHRSRWNPATLALVGGATAVAATFATYHARRWLSRYFSDRLVAVAEDAVTARLGASIA